MRVLSNMDRNDSRKVNYLIRSFSLLLGVGLGPIVGLLIVGGNWPVALVLVVLIPIALLLITYPFAAVMFWLLLMPFFAITPDVPTRLMYWTLHRAMIPIALGVIILSGMLGLKKSPSTRINWGDMMTLLFAGMVIFSTLLLNSSPVSTLIVAYDRILMPFFSYWLIRLTAPRQKDLQRVLPIALVVLVSQSAIGLLSWFAPQVLPSAWLGLQGLRTTGSLNNPAVYSTTLIFLSLLMFQAAMQREVGVTRLVFLIAFGLGAVSVFLSFSRGSWLGALLVSIGLLILYPKATLRTGLILLAVIVLLGSGALSTQMTWASDRLEDKGTIDARVVGMHAAMRMIQAKPLWGWGYNNYDRYDRQFQERTDNYSINYDETSHHAWLTIMTEMGLIGFLIFLFPFAWWLRLTLKVRTRMSKTGFWSWPLLAMFWLVIGSFFIVNNFMDMRYFPFGLTLLWVTLAFAANMVDSYLRTGGLVPTPGARRAASSFVLADTV